MNMCASKGRDSKTECERDNLNGTLMTHFLTGRCPGTTRSGKPVAEHGVAENSARIFLETKWVSVAARPTVDTISNTRWLFGNECVIPWRRRNIGK